MCSNVVQGFGFAPSKSMRSLLVPQRLWSLCFHGKDYSGIKIIRRAQSLHVNGRKRKIHWNDVEWTLIAV
jgi:hypothetical protein